jgi:hypothetical protein
LASKSDPSAVTAVDDQRGREQSRRLIPDVIEGQRDLHGRLLIGRDPPVDGGVVGDEDDTERTALEPDARQIDGLLAIVGDLHAQGRGGVRLDDDRVVGAGVRQGIVVDEALDGDGVLRVDGCPGAAERSGRREHRDQNASGDCGADSCRVHHSPSSEPGSSGSLCRRRSSAAVGASNIRVLTRDSADVDDGALLATTPFEGPSTVSGGASGAAGPPTLGVRVLVG